MPQPNLQIFFDGLNEATPGMPCYDPAQPWFAQVTVANANNKPISPYGPGDFDKDHPTAKAGGFQVSFEVFAGVTASTGTLHLLAPFTVDGLDAHPDGEVYMKSFSMQLPKGMPKDDFGAKHGFRFKADVFFAVPESNEDDNTFTWEKAQTPKMAPVALPDKLTPPNPFSSLKFIDFKAVPGSRRELDMRVENVGSETSYQLELRLSIMGPPTPRSPLGSVLETATANSTNIASGASTWVRFTAQTDFVVARADLPARAFKTLQAAPGARRFRQVQAGTSSANGLNGQTIPRFLVVDKDFDFVPLKPFTILLMNQMRSEKVAFGESPVGGGKKPGGGGGGPIAIPHK